MLDSWTIPVAFFPSLKQNFIAYRSSKVSDRIFEIHQLWRSGFSKVYSNFCCRCSFEHEIIKISQSSHKMYSNNILSFQESTTILNAFSRKSGNLLKAHHIYLCACVYMYLCISMCIYDIFVYIHSCMYVCVFIYICVCVCVCMYIYIYILVSMCVYIYIYIYI